MKKLVAPILIGAAIGLTAFFLWRNAHLPPVEQPKNQPREFTKNEADLRVGDYFDLRGRTEVLITIDHNEFNPRIIIVAKGVKIFLKNVDPVAHFVNSRELKPGEFFSVVLDQPGTYSYRSDDHPDTMRALIIVK